MDHSGYVALTRQSGLLREMQVVANNIANAATTGFRQQGVAFSEYIDKAGRAPSVSMAHANVSSISDVQGAFKQTGGLFDLAIEGPGYFMVDTGNGERLTRAGHFSPNAVGELVTPDGHRVLDVGGAAMFVPPDARDIRIAQDGTLSVEGRPLGQIGIYSPSDPTNMRQDAGALFDPVTGIEDVLEPRVIQGFVEASNVNAITQLARMIEVQRAYEMGQSFLDAEDQRIRDAVRSLTR